MYNTDSAVLIEYCMRPANFHIIVYLSNEPQTEEFQNKK